MEENYGKKLSITTIKKYLNSLNIYAFSPIKKPILSKLNIGKRKELCNKWVFKNNNFWNKVIFSDECKLNLFNSDTDQFVWREPNKRLDPKHIEGTFKFGKGSVLVWGCFSSKGLGDLVFIDVIMDKWLAA